MECALPFNHASSGVYYCKFKKYCIRGINFCYFNLSCFFPELRACTLALKGSSKLSRDLGIRPVVIGLTVVAFGTSSPELAVSFTAAIKGSNGLSTVGMMPKPKGNPMV